MAEGRRSRRGHGSDRDRRSCLADALVEREREIDEVMASGPPWSGKQRTLPFTGSIVKNGLRLGEIVPTGIGDGL